MKVNSKIYVAGHRGMVGSAITKLLTERGYKNLIFATSSELDLRDQQRVKTFFKREKPDYVILAAAKVGGINANMEKPATFIYDNLAIQNNVIHESYLNGVKKLVFLGSSCIYPKNSPQPMKEEYLLTGELEPTNEGYALAKIAGLKTCENYYKQYGFRCLSVMPPNLYGPNDSFDLIHSHVLSALIKRFVDAAEIKSPSVALWGTGIARREFMHVNDCAEAVLFLIDNYDCSKGFINIGTGEDISIKDLAGTISKKTGYKGKIIWDNTRPDGMLVKRMDVSRMHELGFKPRISLTEGIEEMIDIYKKQKSKEKFCIVV